MGKWAPWLFVIGGFVCLALVALFSDAPASVLLGLAACLTAVSGLMTAVTAMKRSGKEAESKAEADCLRRLTRARHRVEKLVEENKRLKGSR